MTERTRQHPQERVLLALVNRATSKLMYKCSIPVGELQPGRHYNICMLLGKARDRRPSMRHPRLYLTLYLVNHLTDEVTRWEALVSQAITRLQAAVDVSSLPLDPKHGLATVYKLVGDSSMAREPPTLSAG